MKRKLTHKHKVASHKHHSKKKVEGYTYLYYAVAAFGVFVAVFSAAFSVLSTFMHI